MIVLQMYCSDTVSDTAITTTAATLQLAGGARVANVLLPLAYSACSAITTNATTTANVNSNNAACRLYVCTMFAVFRELAVNYCYNNPHYDSYEGEY
jgi:hypothetical protein